MDSDTHLDTIVAARLYLVTAYYRRPCPALAAASPGTLRVSPDIPTQPGC